MKIGLCFGLLTLMMLILLMSGCSSDTTYTPPEKVDQAAPFAQAQVPAPASAEATPPESKPELPKVTIFKVGETATDNELKVTVNSIRFAEVIAETNNKVWIAEAPEGKEYAIIDLTVENILADKTQNIAIAMYTSITDQDGYTYSPDTQGWVNLAKRFNNQQILPGMKSRGEVAYLVPKEAVDLKFIYKFDLFTATSAVFDIK